jgi:hypothetical protein
MVDFATFKKSSSALDRLTKEIEKVNAPASDKKAGDDRFWKLERDKSGNGSAIIRFLPAPAVDGDDALPWVRVFNHGFKGPTGKWYIENSLTTLNQKDPVSEYNSELWNQSSDDNSWQRKQARAQKRRLQYISNILVVSDTKNPENEGKIFLFKYGKKIFDKITLIMNPEFEGDTPVNPFDFWKGANFKLRIRTVDGYPNYDQSVFDAGKPVSDDDASLEAMWKREYSLKELIAPSNFKSYEDLKKHLNDVLGLDEDAAWMKKAAPASQTQSQTFEKPTFNKQPAPKTAENDVPFDVDDDDEDLKAFKNLALG